MEEFTIRGNGNYIKLSIDEVYGFPDNTSHWGGYDTKSTLEIYSNGFQVKSLLYVSTGELYEFLRLLRGCNSKLNGTIHFNPYVGNLELYLEYDDRGHVNIRGEFYQDVECLNRLIFEFNSDQTYISDTIKELETIVVKYGNNKGK